MLIYGIPAGCQLVGKLVNMVFLKCNLFAQSAAEIGKSVYHGIVVMLYLGISLCLRGKFTGRHGFNV